MTKYVYPCKAIHHYKHLSMNKKLLFIGALALCSIASSAQEIKVYDTHRKWSASFDAIIQGKTVKRLNTKGLTTEATTNTLRVKVITAPNQSESIKDLLEKAGYEAEVATNQMVVASISAHYIPTLAKQDDVLYIEEPRQFRTFMKDVRTDIGATKAQNGTSLDTPYDGTGVIVGVIDQGFEFDHPAFKNSAKRWGASIKNGSLRTTAPNSDSTDDVGHATHVSNIAIGRKVSGSNYSGVAPGAEFLPMMSELSDDAIILQAKAIKNYAESQGKPWVINMSFGGDNGPHDGCTSYDQSLNNMCGKGGIMVAAASNSGNIKHHAQYTFTADNDTVYLYIKPDSYNTDHIILSNIASNSADGKEDINAKLVIFYNGKLYTPTQAQLDKGNFYFESEINPYSNKQNILVSGYGEDLAKAMGIRNVNSCYFMWELSGKKGTSFHAWAASDYSDFARITKKINATNKSITTLSGDTDYTYGEGGASIPNSISVASYNMRTTYKNINGGYSSYKSLGSPSDISTFSSKGPGILPSQTIPTVAAPGGVIISAFSKNSEDFDEYSNDNVQRVTVDGKKYYYGVMSGTSMACPVVTGTIALWLQANPDLTPNDIKDIIKKTARHDTYTDNITWDKSWGYGKIDAYEGLKQAILLRTAINETFNTSTPISIEKSADAWKVLFNNDESYAHIQVVAINGQVIKELRIDQPRHGNESIINLQNLTPGVYLLRVNTTASSATKKIIVK